MSSWLELEDQRLSGECFLCGGSDPDSLSWELVNDGEDDWQLVCEDCVEMDEWPSGGLTQLTDEEEQTWFCECGNEIDDDGYVDGIWWFCGLCDEPPAHTAPPPLVLVGPPAPAGGGSSQLQNRQRNLRDLQTLRERYPNYCTHHLFYRHVLQQPGRGCTLVSPEAAGCNQGGRFRSHDSPADLADQDLLAFKE